MCLVAFIVPILLTVCSFHHVYILMLVAYGFEVLPSVKTRIAVFRIAMMHSLMVSTTLRVEPAVFCVKADYVGSQMLHKMLLFIYQATKTTHCNDTEDCKLVFFSMDERVIR
jgi:hypothetical protein